MSERAPQEQLASYVTGCFVSQAVFVAAKLGLADLLAEGLRTAEELAGATGTHARSLYRLLRALASVGICEEDEHHRFTVTPLGALLRTDAPGSQRATALMWGGAFYHAWGDLLGSVQTGRPAFEAHYGRSCFDWMAEHPEEGAVFDDAMTALNDRKTLAMLEAYDFSGVHVLADVGGGNGGTLIRILRRYPSMRGILFDLPHVVERARPTLATAGTADRCAVVGGSFLESVPSSADAYLLRHILHNWDDAHASQILRKLRLALTPGSKLLVVERVIPRGNAPLFGKLMDLSMLVVHGGAERTEEEFRRLFETAGIWLTRIVPTTAEVSVIEGEID